MRKPRVRVIAQSRELHDSLVAHLLTLGLVELAGPEMPDFICFGCVDRICSNDLEAAGDLHCPIVLVTPEGSEELAIQALRCGVRDYLRMPFSREELERITHSIVGEARSAGSAGAERMVGESHAVRDIKQYINRVAKTSSNVLITGETGTGKELVAELIHKGSSRANQPFVCINCAAIPDSLLESELFGYERGAFTGAHASRDGKLKQAHLGTVFLDEIGDMSPYAQAKVLRAIESREIQRLGSNKTQSVDIRIVAATNRDLAVGDFFRRDLYFRLNVARIHLPPLRERREDILPLAHSFRLEGNRKFHQATQSFTESAEQALLAHDWPGNIRELKNSIEAAFINLDAGATTVRLPQILSDAIAARGTLETSESDRILMALYATQWNRSRAAQKLKWSRMTLYRKKSRYGISELASQVPLVRASAG